VQALVNMRLASHGVPGQQSLLRLFCYSLAAVLAAGAMRTFAHDQLKQAVALAFSAVNAAVAPLVVLLSTMRANAESKRSILKQLSDDTSVLLHQK